MRAARTGVAATEAIMTINAGSSFLKAVVRVCVLLRRTSLSPLNKDAVKVVGWWEQDFPDDFLDSGSFDSGTIVVQSCGFVHC
jgi:hypothetical protein